MTSNTLTKLGAIADFADNNNQYDVAGQITNLLKQAQLWDSLKTLFDPEHTPGVDRNTPFWKRLSKGWARGKMDRHLGLVLAIMTERTKLNNKINELIAPLKDFQAVVGTFYEKIRGGSITSENIREESRELQNGLKDTLKLISGKDLREILRMREKLEKQQLIAAEKIKGLDEETRGNLMAVLQGQSLPGANPRDEINSDRAGTTSYKDLSEDEKRKVTEEKVAKWMRSVGVKNKGLREGLQSKNVNMFRPFVNAYQANPFVVLEFFNNNPQALEKGFDVFGREFSNMYYWAENAVNKDREAAEKEKQIPGSGETVKPAEEGDTEPTPVVKENPENKVELPTVNPALKSKPPAPTTFMTAPPEHGTSPEEEELRKSDEVAGALEDMRLKNNLKNIDTETIKKRLEEQRLRRQIEQANVLKAIPIEKRRELLAEPVTSTAQRVGREINRLARLRNFKKIANDTLLLDDEDLLDVLDPIGIQSEDIFDQGLDQELYEDEKDYNPTQTRLDEYEDVQAPDDYEDDEDAEDLERKYERLLRKIKFLEMTGEDPGLILKLDEECRQLSNRIEYMKSNSYKERLN